MNVAAYVEALQQDLANVAGIGDDAIAEAARRISTALESSLRLRLTDALGEAAAELTNQLPDGHVEVRVTGGDPELVYVPEPGAPQRADHAASAGDPQGDRRRRRPGGGRVGEHLAAPADHAQRGPRETAALRRAPHDRLRPELKGVTMHVLPLPFGLALALLPRRE